MLKKLFKVLTSRLSVVGIVLLVQLIYIFAIVWQLSISFAYADLIMTLIAIIIVLVIINKWDNPSYKLAWTFVILTFPVFGLLLYVIFGRAKLTKRTQSRFDKVMEEFQGYLKSNEEVTKELEILDKSVANQSKYITNWAGYPPYKNTETKYYPCGEIMFESMIVELKKAKHYIFLEYFIIEKGKMWNTILEILEEKVKEGVEVRLMYDDVGCVTVLPYKYYKVLQSKGIKCAAFNPFRPFLSVIMNNRDHRKILVIDGHTGFTGGLNLADEYINEIERFGYWKDTGIMLKGEGVWNLTMMFLSIWQYVSNVKEDHQQYKPSYYQEKPFIQDGFVQPYGDSPLDHENVGENIYLNIINRAKDYVYIFTPYLIIDNEMITALCNAAKSGVDVRIITPGIPDKKIIFCLSQSYYIQLIDSGIKIYQYEPGFLHAKCFVCDDIIATVGTINMDYRSLFLHFECGVFMYQSKAIMEVKEDVLQTIEVSKEITPEFCHQRPWIIKTLQGALRMFAPLL